MRRKTKKFNIFKILSVILIFIFILSIPFAIQKLIKIKKIECVSQFGQCPDQIISNLQFTIPNQLLISKFQIKKQLDNNIQINNYLIQYKIPDTLKVEINIKKPKYAIFNNQKYFLLDKEGLILNENIETNLPTLVIANYQNIIGGKISDTELYCLKIIEKVAWLYSVKTGYLVSGELKITLKEGIIVHFPIEGDIDTLVGSLRLVFSRLNDGHEAIKISEVQEIDLRFKQPILR